MDSGEGCLGGKRGVLGNEGDRGWRGGEVFWGFDYRGAGIGLKGGKRREGLKGCD